MAGGATVLDDPDHVVLALHPLRRKVLALLEEPDSATGLARRLDTTRQKVNYHVRALEDAGLVQEVEQRQQRGLVERLVARTYDDILIDPAVVGLDRLDTPSRSGLGGALAAAVTVLRHVAAISRGAAARKQSVASVTIDADVRLADPAALRAFSDDLAALIANHDQPGPGAMRFRCTATVLPHIGSDDD